MLDQKQRPGDITAAGLLYEGNYVEWEKRMNATLRVRGLPSMESSSGFLRIFSAFREDCSIRVRDCILANVSPALLQRIPAGLRSPDIATFEIVPLLEAIKSCARPFRLLDLPPEIRCRIYTFVLAGTAPYKIKADGTFSTRGPPLLHVSRLVHQETLPISYSNSTFTHGQPIRMSYLDHLGTFQRWIERTVKHNAQHLRHFDFDIGRDHGAEV